MDDGQNVTDHGSNFICENKTWNAVERTWLTENGTLIKRIHFYAITENVKRAAQEHFKCPGFWGAELNAMRWLDGTTTPQVAHWIGRVFPDELMAPRGAAVLRVSNLTLGVLKDSGWYEVDLSKAEPLDISRPQVDGCERAKRSCHEIIGTVVPSRPRDEQIGDLAPYCVNNQNPIYTPRCTKDGKVALQCGRVDYVGVDNCVSIAPIRPFGENTYGYDHAICELATKQSENATMIGGTVGRNTMCITVVRVPYWKYNADDQYPLPLCVIRNCEYRRKIVTIYLAALGKRECAYLCYPEYGGKIVTMVLPSPCERQMVAFVCPKFDDVCTDPPTHHDSTIPAIKGISTSSRGVVSAVQGISPCIWAGLIMACVKKI